MRTPIKSGYPQTCPSCRAAAWAFGGLLAGILLTSATARAQEAEFEGQKVAEVRIVDETGTAVSEKTPPIALEAGNIFDFAAERESVRKLYRTGDYSDIRVTATPASGGLRVDFVVRRNYYNNVVKVLGVKDPPSEPATLAALRLGLGEPFRESSLKEGIERLQEALHDDGLYLAKLTWSLVPIEDTRQMDITVTVDPGPRAHVGNLIIENQTKFPDAEILRRAKISSKNEAT
jgi:outer membrane protein insertion porin family